MAGARESSGVLSLVWRVEKRQDIELVCPVCHIIHIVQTSYAWYEEYHRLQARSKETITSNMPFMKKSSGRHLAHASCWGLILAGIVQTGDGFAPPSVRRLSTQTQFLLDLSASYDEQGDAPSCEGSVPVNVGVDSSGQADLTNRFKYKVRRPPSSFSCWFNSHPAPLQLVLTTRSML